MPSPIWSLSHKPKYKMSLNRLTASGLMNNLEIAPAFANFNFDFTLYEEEAPREFEGVGKSLSKTRKADAESGQLHVVARQLGALFAGILPKTPALISAYGSRASEITSASA
ncbi:MAG: hypothetical protein Q9162_003592 [Coniocarpon cinnabarinum]